MHQGWLKFAASLWMAGGDGGLACVSIAPCEVNTRIAGVATRVCVDGTYPFDDHATIRVVTDRVASFP